MRLPKALLISSVILLFCSTAAALRLTADHRVASRPTDARLALAPGQGYAVTTASAGATGSAPVSDPAGSAAGRVVAPAAHQAPALPTPTSAALPTVAPLKSTHSADALVLLTKSLTSAEANALTHSPGLTAIEEADTGTVKLAGAPAATFGVDPGTFRSFTPTATAASNQLWRYLAGGALVSSYEMASDRRLELGVEEPIGSGDVSKGWMGAFASIGLPGVDMLVDRSYSKQLGLTPDSGLVISAPGVDGLRLDNELQKALPGASVELLHPDQVSSLTGGGAVSSAQSSTVISAALSRVGMPYVWGGAGPNDFDCSGLVQWSFAQAGILMPRTADQQYLTGVQVPLADASPGDLLFWTYDPNDPGFVDHTAIYLGNGMMVVAPHTGLDVQVVPVPTADFAGAVHVLLKSA